MKYIVIILILGISEVSLIGKLHEALGTKHLILFYLATTVVGIIVAWISYTPYKGHKSTSKLSNKLGKRIREGRMSDKDNAAMVSVLYCTIYFFSCVLIAIPGIVTDIIGIVLLLPPVTSSLAIKYAQKGVDMYAQVNG